MLELPVIVVNFKNYEQCYGRRAVELARLVEAIARETGASLAVAPNNIDLYRVCQAVAIPVFAQHVTDITFGSYTGHVLPEAVKEAGATGTLLNHAEKARDLQTVRRAVERCRQVGLLSVVCAASMEQSGQFAAMRPDLLALEPPELIGGEVSVTTKRELLAAAVARSGTVPLLCGAGVRSPHDVHAALELGMRGVLLSSGVVLAENPRAALTGLARAVNA